ncbi:MAG TPA: hypothetical protein VKB18_03310 [Gemmatimonadota bacterium]|nr:hypothetical protein [Gemmatimonadota bacterium]
MAVTELIVLIAFFAVLLPLGRALVRRVEDPDDRRIESGDRSSTAGTAPSGQEITELRRQVARLSERVDKLGEEQDFLVRLLEERPRLGTPERHETRSSGS